MSRYQLTLDSITKAYGRRLIFRDVNFDFTSRNVYGIAGRNGSGKSTLAKIISGVISPTKGDIIHKPEGDRIPFEKLHNYLGFVSPYLVLYDEFSAEENLRHFSKIRGIDFDNERSDHLFNELNIYDRRNDPLKAYSSGMKQRVKFVFALLHRPPLLLLDEPTSNLDNAGKDKVYEIIHSESRENLIIIASNEQSDLELCKEILYVENYNKSDS